MTPSPRKSFPTAFRTRSRHEAGMQGALRDLVHVQQSVGHGVRTSVRCDAMDHGRRQWRERKVDDGPGRERRRDRGFRRCIASERGDAA